MRRSTKFIGSILGRAYAIAMSEDGAEVAEYILVVSLLLSLAVVVYALIGVIQNKYAAMVNYVNGINVP